MLIYGINAVTEALKAGRVVSLRVGRRSDRRLEHLLILAGQSSVPIRRVPDEELDRDARGAARIRASWPSWWSGRRSSPAIWFGRAGGRRRSLVVLDGIEDPHNSRRDPADLDAAGVHGVMRQTRRSAAWTARRRRPRPAR